MRWTFLGFLFNIILIHRFKNELQINSIDMNNITFITWHHVINRIQFGCNNRKMHHFSLQLFGNVLENVQAKVDCDQIRKKKKNEQTKTRFCHFYGISYSFEGGWLNMASSFAYNSFMHTMNFAREWVINVMAIAIYNSFQLFNSTQNVHFVAYELQWQKNHLNYWNFDKNIMIYAVYLVFWNIQAISTLIVVINYDILFEFSLALFIVHRKKFTLIIFIILVYKLSIKCWNKDLLISY